MEVRVDVAAKYYHDKGYCHATQQGEDRYYKTWNDILHSSQTDDNPCQCYDKHWMNYLFPIQSPSVFFFKEEVVGTEEKRRIKDCEQEERCQIG